MNAYANTGDFGRKFSDQFEEWMDVASAELRQAVTYVDHVIIPEVRRESAGALRNLAVQLVRLADRLDPQDVSRGQQ